MTDDNRLHHQPAPERVGGAAGDVTQAGARRIPGTPHPDAPAIALERLLEAMCLISGISKDAAAGFALAFKVCAVTAPKGAHGMDVVKILATVAKRLDAHIAGLHTPPS